MNSDLINAGSGIYQPENPQGNGWANPLSNMLYMFINQR